MSTHSRSCQCVDFAYLLNTVLTLGFGDRHWGQYADGWLHAFEAGEAEWQSVATEDDLKNYPNLRTPVNHRTLHLALLAFTLQQDVKP